MVNDSEKITAKKRKCVNLDLLTTKLTCLCTTNKTSNYEPTHSQKRVSCNKSVDILEQLVITSRYQDAFPWLAAACENKSVVSCQQACCKLSTDLLQDDYCNFFQQVVTSLQMTSCNNPDLNRTCCNLMKLTTCNKSVTFLAV